VTARAAAQVATEFVAVTAAAFAATAFEAVTACFAAAIVVVMGKGVPERMKCAAFVAGVESVVRWARTRKTVLMTHLGTPACVLRCVLRYISKDSLSNSFFAIYGRATKSAGSKERLFRYDKTCGKAEFHGAAHSFWRG
jgi:hypothetical protein